MNIGFIDFQFITPKINQYNLNFKTIGFDHFSKLKYKLKRLNVNKTKEFQLVLLIRMKYIIYLCI